MPPPLQLFHNGVQRFDAVLDVVDGRAVVKGGELLDNDMIFAIICEELGIVGAGIVILMFLILLWRIYDVATTSPDLFSGMICTGVMAQIAVQVLANIAVVTNSIPSTGIALPFISYGGSSVIFLLAEIGLVLQISKKRVKT